MVYAHCPFRLGRAQRCCELDLILPFSVCIFLGGGGERSRAKSVIYGLDDWGLIIVRGNDEILSLCHHIQTCSGAHPVSCPMGEAKGKFVPVLD